MSRGLGDVYKRQGAGFSAGIGYLGQKQQTVDMNLVVNHWGQKTTSEINAAGALKDDAQKIFRGTIDFKKGSAGSVGSEQETVLMLGDGVVNKTVPLILCAEENVVGNHGATIGELDEDTRTIWSAEHDARVAITLAAACFAAGTCITRCYVQIAAPDGEQGERVVATYFFGRAAYLADDRNLTAKFVAGQKILG